MFQSLSPGGFLFVRYLLMPVAAVLLLCWRYGLRWPRLPRSEVLVLLRLGLLGHLLHVGLVTYGIHWSTAFSSSLILAVGPVFTLLILRWRGQEETLTRWQVAGVAVAVAGVLLFLSDKLLGGLVQAGAGDLVLLVAAAFFSLYTVMAKPLFERHGGVLVMAYATLLGSGPVVLVSLPAGLQMDWAAVPPLIWAGTLWAVLVSAFLGWLVWGWVNAVRGVARSAPLDVPDAGGGRPGGLGAHRRALHHHQAGGRCAGPGRRGAGAVRHRQPPPRSRRLGATGGLTVRPRSPRTAAPPPTFAVRPSGRTLA